MRSLLAFPAAYAFFDRLIGGRSARRRFVEEHVRASAGDRVLDIGCGPASILKFLPAVEYVGFDRSSAYVTAARKRHATRGRFFCGVVSQIDLEEHDFDIAIALGVVHHLDDGEALQLFRLGATALRPGGRLVTLDGCLADGQPAIARYMLGRDRGRYVRDQSGYEHLAGQVFRDVRSSVRSDLLRFAYTHIVLECTRR